MKLILLSILLLAIPASAYEGCEPTTSEADIGLSTRVAGEWYVENSPCQPDCASYLRLYEETNGIEGLQRSDETVDDTCGGAIPADTLREEIQYSN